MFKIMKFYAIVLVRGPLVLVLDDIVLATRLALAKCPRARSCQFIHYSCCTISFFTCEYFN